MRTKIAVVIIAWVIVVTGFISMSFADEAVFCVSEENRYVVLIGSGDRCLEEETELKISGADVKIADDLDSLANFTVNDACGEGSAGTKTDVGLDYNANGKLEPREILSSSSSCRTMKADNDN